jgi:hypothetical protein
LYQRRRGTRLAAIGFIVMGPIASFVTLGVLWPVSNAGIEYVRSALYTPDSGASTACLACLGMSLAGEKGLRRNIALLGILAVLGLAFVKNEVYNFDHLSGYLVGLGSGAIITLWQHHKNQE